MSHPPRCWPALQLKKAWTRCSFFYVTSFPSSFAWTPLHPLKTMTLKQGRQSAEGRFCVRRVAGVKRTVTFTDATRRTHEILLFTCSVLMLIVNIYFIYGGYIQ